VLNAQSCKYDMYKSSLRHIHDPVLSSLKMKGIRSFFFFFYTSGRTMALGLTQPLTEMSTRNISWG
jgi:hypothetical protein